MAAIHHTSVSARKVRQYSTIPNDHSKMPHYPKYLINTETQCLERINDPPGPYAILSHTWGDDEIVMDDMRTKESRATSKRRKGYQKLSSAVHRAKSDGYGHIWIDTCCINQASSAELSEAINAMHEYYANSAVCYSYLEDISDAKDLDSARWFSRGWTLQELVFSPHMQFYCGPDRNTFMGDKHSLLDVLASRTGISPSVLTRKMRLDQLSIAHRMSWLADRQTSRPEDMAYCMLGIFDVSMTPIYGEGDKAFHRLQECLLKEHDDQSLLAWTGPPSRWGVLADHPGVFARACTSFLQNLADNWTRAHLRAVSDGHGRLRATMICWQAEPHPDRWQRWYAILNHFCCQEGNKDRLHMIALTQIQRRRLMFVREDTQTHFCSPYSLMTLMSRVAFEEGTHHTSTSHSWLTWANVLKTLQGAFSTRAHGSKEASAPQPRIDRSLIPL